MLRKMGKAHWVILLFISGSFHGCSDGSQEPVSKMAMDSKQESFNQQTTSSNRFPTGAFKAKNIVLEVKGGPTFNANEMELFDVVAEITFVGSEKIRIETSARMRQTSASPTKNDSRVDHYRVQWSDDKHGKLINQNTAEPSADFIIDGGELTIKAWVARNNAFETQIYVLTN